MVGRAWSDMYVRVCVCECVGLGCSLTSVVRKLPRSERNRDQSSERRQIRKTLQTKIIWGLYKKINNLHLSRFGLKVDWQHARVNCRRIDEERLALQILTFFSINLMYLPIKVYGICEMLVNTFEYHEKGMKKHLRKLIKQSLQNSKSVSQPKLSVLTARVCTACQHKKEPPFRTIYR